MITPTVGRVVYFRPGSGARARMAARDDQPLRADILFVRDDRHVALNVDDHDGKRHFLPNVLLLQDGDIAPPGASYAEWMAYQKGQAAKTEDVTGELLRRIEVLEAGIKAFRKPKACREGHDAANWDEKDCNPG